MSELTKEELLELLKKQEEHFKAEIEKRDNKISSLERNFAELQEKFNEVVKKYEKELHFVKVNNHNKYYSTKEKSFVEENNKDASSPINEVEVNLDKKRGRPQGSKNFASINLEALAKETITLDAAPDLISKPFNQSINCVSFK